jgi:putative copper resistance protein D
MTAAVATMSGLGAYDTTLFSAHMAQHVLLGMVTPFLLALAAPVTLAVQASDRRTQRAILRLVHHPVARVAAHPIVAWGVFAATPFALYFTPLYELSVRNAAVHVAVHAHLVVAGCLFAWPAVGVDPSPRPLPHGARVLYLVVAVPFHAFVGVALLGARAVLAGAEASAAAARLGVDALADQRLGAGILWASGDLLGLVAAGVALVRWMAADEREAARADRTAEGLAPSKRQTAPEAPSPSAL